MKSDFVTVETSPAFDEKTEMAWGVGATLMIFGILGINHSPVFGIFAVTTLQNIFYIVTGLTTITFIVTHKNLPKYMAILFGILGFLGLIFPIGSFADSYLHFFVSACYAWMHLRRNEKRSITIHPA